MVVAIGFEPMNPRGEQIYSLPALTTCISAQTSWCDGNQETLVDLWTICKPFTFLIVTNTTTGTYRLI